METSGHVAVGGADAAFNPAEFSDIISDFRRPVHIVFNEEKSIIGLLQSGKVSPERPQGKSYPLIGTLPPLYPEWLGDRNFQKAHSTRFPYVGGAMAKGIASAEMVIELAKAGCLGFFGAGGVPLDRIEQELTLIKDVLEPLGLSWGANLLNSLDLRLEEETVELYLRLGVRRISAAAYLSASKQVVHYACKGLSKKSDGSVVRMNHVFAKISRPETAKVFLSPAPDAMLNELVSEGKLTSQEAEIAATIPIAEDITVEGDSGGHTDNRPMKHGQYKSNMELSEFRARAVAKFFVELFGINKNVFTTVGRGDTVPVATNDTPEGRKENRRVIYWTSCENI